MFGYLHADNENHIYIFSTKLYHTLKECQIARKYCWGDIPDSYYIKEYYFTVVIDGDQADSNTSKYGFLVVRKNGSLAGIYKFLYDNYEECNEALKLFFHNCYRPESKKKGLIFKVISEANYTDEQDESSATDSCSVNIYNYNCHRYMADDGYLFATKFKK